MKGPLAISILIAVSGSAFAADMGPASQFAPLRYPPTNTYSWSGCYFGGEGGLGWGSSRQIAASSRFIGSPITNTFGVSGPLLGATIGCNYQAANFVFGAEGDASWSNIVGKVSQLPPFDSAGTTSTYENSFSTLRGRAGFAWDRLFFYGTGGGALANVEVNVLSSTGLTNSDSQMRSGWVAGGGIEWAPLIRECGLTFKIEYLHADFGTGLLVNPQVTITTPNFITTFVTQRVSLTNDIVRVGLNWKFVGW